MHALNVKIDIADKALFDAVSQIIDQVEQLNICVEVDNSHFIISDQKKTDFSVFPAIFSCAEGEKIRVGSILKRLYTQTVQRQPSFSFGDFEFIPDTKTLLDKKSNQTYILTDLESALLIYLEKQGEKYATKDDLLKDVWNYQQGVTTHTVETHIYRLRQKVPGLDQHLLTTDHGYVLE